MPPQSSPADSPENPAPSPRQSTSQEPSSSSPTASPAPKTRPPGSWSRKCESNPPRVAGLDSLADTRRAGDRARPGPALRVAPGQLRERIPALAPAKEKEGFRIRTNADGNGAPVVAIIGNDERGVLFGVGRLLRELNLAPSKAALADPLNVATAPKYPLRGYQLGYRPKTNSYDGWDVPSGSDTSGTSRSSAQRHRADPPRSDDAADSPHFPLPPWR